MRRTLFTSTSMAMAALLLVMTAGTVYDFHAAVHARNVPVQGKGDMASGGCRECHAPFYATWSVSRHGLSIQPYTDDFAQQALVPLKNDITVGKRSYRVETGRGQGFMVEKGAWAWSGKQYRITHVLGGRNVYFFFTPAERGRLKALPLAFDVQKKTWIERASSGIMHADRDILDSNEDLVFNSACYGCHVNPLSTNYDLKTDSYTSILQEPGIQCEACHGSAAEHAAVMEKAPGGVVPKDLRINRATGNTSGIYGETCAPCHARVSPITATYLPGDTFFDHFDLVTLENQDFYPDGRDRGENHTYGSWLMNPCARAGKLSCIHCHTPGGGYRFDKSGQANNACMPCHEKTVANLGRHTHHAPLSPASMCISCHMPPTGIGTSKHTDHSMLPPTPATSLLYGSPNACTACHRDKSAEWASQWAKKWYGDDYQASVLKRAGLVDAARRKDWTKLDEMLAFVQSGDRDEVNAASLIRLLEACPDPSKVSALRAVLKDPSPLVRSAAAESLGSDLSPEVIRDLIKAASDPVRIVRVRAASALLHRSMVVQPGDEAKILSKATGEYLASLMVLQDRWTSHAAMGNYFLDQGDAKNALMAFKAASKLNPRAVPPYVSASIAHAKLGNLSQAEEELNNALQVDPANAPALFNMGLLKNEQGKTQEAVTYLKEAFKSDPTLAAAAFNLAVIISASSMKDAQVWARKAYELHPDAKYGYTLAYFIKQDGDWNESIDILNQLITRYPLNTDAYLLLGDIFEKKGKVIDAEAVYKKGLSVQGMTDLDRGRIEKRLRKLK